MNLTFYDKIFKPKEYVLPNGKKAYKKASRAPIYAILILAMCVLSVKITGFDMEVLVDRIGQFFVILGEMFPPKTDYMPKIWGPLFDTIKMSLLGSVVGALLSVPFAMLASTNVCPSKIVVSAMRVMFSLIRTLPTIVIALVATLVFGLGTLAGTVAIAVFSHTKRLRLLIWEHLKLCRRWEPQELRLSFRQSFLRYFRSIFQTACSTLKVTSDMLRFLVM